MELRSTRKRNEYKDLELSLKGMGFFEEGMDLQEMRQIMDALQQSANEGESNFMEADIERAIRESEMDFMPLNNERVFNSTMMGGLHNTSPCSSPDLPPLTIVVRADVHHDLNWSPPCTEAERLQRKRFAFSATRSGNNELNLDSSLCSDTQEPEAKRIQHFIDEDVLYQPFLEQHHRESWSTECQQYSSSSMSNQSPDGNLNEIEHQIEDFGLRFKDVVSTTNSHPVATTDLNIIKEDSMHYISDCGELHEPLVNLASLQEHTGPDISPDSFLAKTSVETLNTVECQDLYLQPSPAHNQSLDQSSRNCSQISGHEVVGPISTRRPPNDSGVNSGSDNSESSPSSSDSSVSDSVTSHSSTAVSNVNEMSTNSVNEIVGPVSLRRPINDSGHQSLNDSIDNSSLSWDFRHRNSMDATDDETNHNGSPLSLDNNAPHKANTHSTSSQENFNGHNKAAESHSMLAINHNTTPYRLCYANADEDEDYDQSEPSI